MNQDTPSRSWRDRYPVKQVGLVAVLTVLLVVAGSAAVTSVDRIEYESNSAFFDGTTFVISYISDFSTDRINVFLDQDELSDTAGDEVTQDLSISVESQNTFAEYPISTSVEQDLVNLALIESDWFGDQSEADTWAAQNCYDLGQNGNVPYVRHYDLTFTGYQYKIFCSRYNGEWGPFGNIQTPRELFETEWRVEADGEPAQTGTLSNNDIGDGRTTRIGEYVVVEWNGNVDLGRNPPGPGDEGAAAVYLRTANDWRVISESRYGNWDSYVRNTLPIRYEDWAAGDIERSTLQSQIDSRAQDAVREYSSSELAAAETGGDDSSGFLRLDMDNELSWPRFSVYVAACERGDSDCDAYITVGRSVGTPEIVSTEGDRFGEMDSGTVSMTVQNVGDGNGSFSARIQSCSSGFGFDDSQKTQPVLEGATVTYEFDVSFQTDADDEVSGQCTLEVANQEGVSVTDTVDVTGIPQETCQPGERFHRVDARGQYTIYECTQDGMDIFVVEECGFDEVARVVDGELQCVEEEVPPPRRGLWDRLTSSVSGTVSNIVDTVTSPFENLLRTVGLIAAIVVFVLMFNVATHPWMEPFAASTAAVLPLSESQTQYLLGIALGVSGAWLAYDVFTSWLFYVLVFVAAVAYIYIRGLRGPVAATQ